jgi:predicted dehydrogenase
MPRKGRHYRFNIEVSSAEAKAEILGRKGSLTWEQFLLQIPTGHGGTSSGSADGSVKPKHDPEGRWIPVESEWSLEMRAEVAERLRKGMSRHDAVHGAWRKTRNLPIVKSSGPEPWPTRTLTEPSGASPVATKVEAPPSS